MSEVAQVEVIQADREATPQEREWTRWSDQRCPNESGSYRFRASFDLLGVAVTAEWTEELRLCGMGYGESEWWPVRLCHWDGYRRYITHNALEWSPVQAYDPTGTVWAGLNLLPCPFTGKQPNVEIQGRYIGAPMWHAEAIWLSSPAVPKRRWTDAKAMLAHWNTRASEQSQASRIAVLEEALAPFAEACTISNADDDDCIDDTIAAGKITFGHLRRARSVTKAPSHVG